MYSHSEKIEEWRRGARLTELSEAFELLASGLSGKPNIDELLPEIELFGNRVKILDFYKRYRYYSGTFNLHFLTSIPNILEEECRLGSALLEYLRAEENSSRQCANLQTIGNAEGVIARTIASLGNGAISTLTNSPTESNMREFLKKGVASSFFHLGPFFDLTRDRIAEDSQLQKFSEGFDVIYEDTAFQMYGPDRDAQIAFVLQNLRPGGLFISLEKCWHSEIQEYNRREETKDQLFKSKYYTSAQLEDKGKVIRAMEAGQVTCEALEKAIKGLLEHTMLVWNSCNFYIFAASDDQYKLESFSRMLGPTCIRQEFDFALLSQPVYDHSRH